MPHAPWLVQRDDIPLVSWGLESLLNTVASEDTRANILRLLHEAEEARKQ